MLLLIASIVALFAGPLLFKALGSRPEPLAFVDGFVVVALGGLVILHLLPESIALGGVWAVVGAAAGLAAPPFFERVLSGKPVHAWLLWLALAGLAVHAVIDGAALSLDHHHHDEGELLAFAVLLHRVPEGVAVWWLVGVEGGPRRALVVLLLITAGTIVGFVGAEPMLAGVPRTGLAIFQAVVAGLLFHTVFAHPPRIAGPLAPKNRAAGAGALVAALALYFVEIHPVPRLAEGALGAVQTFGVVAFASAPALLAALGAAALLHAAVAEPSARWLGNGVLGPALRGVVFGLPLPICSCNVAPVYGQLVRQAAPTAGAMAFLVAMPQVGLDALVIGVPLLGWTLAALRAAGAALMAIVVGVVVGGRVPKVERPEGHEHKHTHQHASGWRKGVGYAFGDLVDHVAPWLLLGLALGAVIEPLIDPAWFARLPDALEVPLMALVGLPFYVCASGATPLVAVLLHKGLSAGAVLAFLLTGPATHVATFSVLGRRHGRRVAAAFGASVVALAIAIGLAANALMPAAPLVPLHDLAAEPPSMLAMVSVALVGLLFSRSLLRQGPRGLIAQVVTPHVGDEEGHHHHHDHGHHGHDHGHVAHARV